MDAAERAKPKVVVVGAGFGGLAAARELAGAEVDVTVIDRRNYHLFQPLLYQVATAALSPADIAWPIRRLLAGQRNARVLMGRVVGVDRERREVRLGDGARVPYDFLVLATGARHAYFANPEWEAAAPGLKKIDDATELRRRILTAFEDAERADDPAERAALLTFVVVGGGPTGVEMAGALAELARGMAREFRRIDSAAARIVLIEAGPRALASFAEPLSRRAEAALRRLGVELRLGARVTACSEAGVAIGEEVVAARTIVWAAGVMASPAAKWLGAPHDRAGRALVGPDLSVPAAPEIFVIGDTAALTTADGRPVPGVAAAAKQMGRHVGCTIRARVAGAPAPGPFRWRDPGQLATIGGGSAIAQFAGLRLSGFPAWALWAVAHVYFLIGARNRLTVSASWAWSYASGLRHARLITGAEPAERSAVPGSNPT